MELNGIANLKIILESAKENGTIEEKAFQNAYLQIDNFERYLIALHYIPDIKWHEVYPNPSLLPNRVEQAQYEAQHPLNDLKYLYEEWYKIYRGPPLVPTGSDIT